MTTVTRLFAITFALPVALFSTEILGATEISNPGFEDGWTGWARSVQASDAIAISDVSHSGEKSAKLTQNGAYVSQGVAVEPNTKYRLSAFLYGPGNIGVKVGEELFFEQQPEKSKEWRALSVTFDSGPVDVIHIFGSSAGIEVRIDDFLMEAVDDAAAASSARIISSSAGGYGLSPDLPPGRNFDLLGWYLSTPADDDNDNRSDRISEVELARGAIDERYFYTASDGGMVFRATVDGAKTSSNTSYTRTELREMLRRGDTSISTKNDNATPNKNNWVFSSAPIRALRAAGGIDGTLRATLAVNHVTTTGDRGQVGRVIVGQIHAAVDEPIRLYYRKLPENERGSIYAAHEISGGDDVYYELIGSRRNSAANPDDGIALDEKFSYEIRTEGNLLHVSIMQDDKTLASNTIDMAASGYDVSDDYMYFKAGVYNQNNSGNADDFVQATFYELEASHDQYVP
jgi:poly(beta-D-mannuronate) lyase